MSHKDAQSHTPANPPQPAYTLDPLRTEGPDSLQPDGIPEIDKITLREIEITWENANNEVIIRKANDIFKAARDDTHHLPDSFFSPVEFQMGDEPGKDLVFGKSAPELGLDARGLPTV